MIRLLHIAYLSYSINVELSALFLQQIIGIQKIFSRIYSSISKTSFVILKVYDILGREIATLINEEKPVGNFQVEFDGGGLPSAIYFYKLQAGDFVEAKKMILVK